MENLKVNDRVKRSAAALRSKRDYWLAQGNPTRKPQAKEWLDEAVAERGTVAEILAGDSSRSVSPGLRIIWDNGAGSRCLPYMVEGALSVGPRLSKPKKTKQ